MTREDLIEVIVEAVFSKKGRPSVKFSSGKHLNKKDFISGMISHPRRLEQRMRRGELNRWQASSSSVGPFVYPSKRTDPGEFMSKKERRRHTRGIMRHVAESVSNRSRQDLRRAVVANAVFGTGKLEKPVLSSDSLRVRDRVNKSAGIRADVKNRRQTVQSYKPFWQKTKKHLTKHQIRRAYKKDWKYA